MDSIQSTSHRDTPERSKHRLPGFTSLNPTLQGRSKQAVQAVRISVGSLLLGLALSYAVFDGPQEPVRIAKVSTPVVTVTVPLDTLEWAAPVKKKVKRDHFTGNASFYGEEFAGRRTANGETFDPGMLTAAHRTLPLGSRIRVTNTRNGKSIIVRVNDRGPFHGNRMLDLSHAAAKQLGMVQRGTATVRIELLSSRKGK